MMKNKTTPRGLRNNNPLNIIKSKTVRWLGETHCEAEQTFCQFSSMTYGLDQQGRDHLTPYLENAWSLL